MSQLDFLGKMEALKSLQERVIPIDSLSGHLGEGSGWEIGGVARGDGARPWVWNLGTTEPCSLGH